MGARPAVLIIGTSSGYYNIWCLFGRSLVFCNNSYGCDTIAIEGLLFMVIGYGCLFESLSVVKAFLLGCFDLLDRGGSSYGLGWISI